MTYYEILKVSETASYEEIHTAYKVLLKKYHPDLNRGDTKLASEMTRKIIEAFDVLSKPEKRSQYDVDLVYSAIANEINTIDNILKLWQSSGVSPTMHSVDSLIINVKTANRKINQITISSEAKRSVRTIIAKIARSGAVFIHNERNDTTLALEIVKVLLNEFGDIGEIRDILKRDQTFLIDQIQETKIYSETQSFSVETANKPRVSKAGIITVALTAIIALYLYFAPSLGETSPAPSENRSSPIQAPITVSEPKDVLIQEPEPLSGEVLFGNEVFDESEITIKAPGGSSYYVKLKDKYKNTLLSFYVRAGATVTVGVPAQEMYVYFASGETWYGIKDLFGERTSYSKDDDLIDFSEYTISYTLYPVSSGNFRETIIDEDEF